MLVYSLCVVELHTDCNFADIQMKRVQMILEDWQHEWLSAEAERQLTTMSALLRQLLSESIERVQAGTLADDPLWGIIGIAEGPNDGVTSNNLDQFVYTMDWDRRPLLKAAETRAIYEAKTPDTGSESSEA